MSVDQAFTRKLPKTELHAHLTGSISRECLHEIWQVRKDEHSNLDLEDPLLALPTGKVDYDIKKFFPLFTTYIYILVNTIPAITKTTISVLQDFVADGVCYLELRTTPRASPNISKDLYVSTVLDSIARYNGFQDQMSTYLILSIDRKNSSAEAMEVVDLAIQFKAKGVVGVDLCGNPFTSTDISKYRTAFAKAKAHGLGVTLHFAEVLASSSPTELRTLLDFQPDRLGHVICVDESIKEEIAQKGMALELCLSCNVHAGLTRGGFADHHVRKWIQRKDRGKVVLGTDDIGVFLSPLSNEYLLVAHHYDLSRETLLQLCEEASDAIFGPYEEKVRIKNKVAMLRQ